MLLIPKFTETVLNIGRFNLCSWAPIRLVGLLIHCFCCEPGHIFYRAHLAARAWRHRRRVPESNRESVVGTDVAGQWGRHSPDTAGETATAGSWSSIALLNTRRRQYPYNDIQFLGDSCTLLPHSEIRRGNRNRFSRCSNSQILTNTL